MKLQVDAGQLRLRLSEAELARLLEQGEVTQALACPDGAPAHCRVGLREDIDGGHCAGNLMDLRVELPRAGFHAFAAERPRRDGFAFSCGALRVLVEVDVRDSHRARRAAAPPAQAHVN